MKLRNSVGLSSKIGMVIGGFLSYKNREINEVKKMSKRRKAKDNKKHKGEKERINECTAPAGENPFTWKDCERCLVAGCGYSRCIEPNPHWREQGGFCEYEHCIENMPLKPEPTEVSCPVFGHNCPEGEDRVSKCRKGLEQRDGSTLMPVLEEDGSVKYLEAKDIPKMRSEDEIWDAEKSIFQFMERFHEKMVALGSLPRDILKTENNSKLEDFEDERHGGEERFLPLDDYMWGTIKGKLSALRWVLGYEWDFLNSEKDEIKEP